MKKKRKKIHLRFTEITKINKRVTELMLSLENKQVNWPFIRDKEVIMENSYYKEPTWKEW